MAIVVRALCSATMAIINWAACSLTMPITWSATIIWPMAIVQAVRDALIKPSR